ncbi:MAG: hypothetical protein K6F76_03460 [Clostridiales bacterium]|nr:hypothetical protein [Clostridiales bacterium]
MKKIISTVLIIAFFVTIVSNAVAEGYPFKDLDNDALSTLLGEHYKLSTDEDEFECSIIKTFDDYCLIRGSLPIWTTENWNNSITVQRKIGDYLVLSKNVNQPYDLGVFAYDGINVYTLEEAVETGLFKMSDVAEFLNVKLMGDVDLNGILDMSDITLLQKVIARITLFSDEYYRTPVADIDQNRKTDMYDVVLVQRMIAKL